MHKNKVIMRLFIMISAVVILFLGLCFYPIIFKSTEKNSGLLVSSKDNNIIEIKDNYPMTDDIGKKITNDVNNSHVQGYYEFEVSSKKSTNFEIGVSDFDFNNTIHSNYIKIYLTDENNVPVKGYDTPAVNTFYNFKVSPLNPTGRRIYYGHLKANKSQKYVLRVWVGDAYLVGTNTNSFGMNVYVKED